VVPEVIGFGALNLDYIYRLKWSELDAELAKFIYPGAESAISDEEFDHLLKIIKKTGTLAGKSGGGQAANTIAALTGMGIHCGYIGKLGRDAAGEYILSGLKGVDTRGIVRGARSGYCLSLLNESGERCILINPGGNDSFCEREIDLDYLNQAKLLYFSSFVGDAPLQAQIMIARSLSLKQALALDPGELYARRGLSAIEGLLSRCRLLFITEQEIKLLTGEAHRQGASRLLETGVGVVICKRGEKGAYLLSADDEFTLPAEKLTAVADRTGAGDVFAAGFIAGWLRGLSLKECTLLGHKAAVYSMQGVGRERYPDREFLEQVLSGLSF
jgi:ribokinase